jgi:SAM-dependent methyltransferase
LVTTVPRGEKMMDWSRPDGYFTSGEDAFRAIRRGLDAAGISNPRRALDLPCGHGRVMRHMRAAWPGAHIVASELMPDGVEFCASAFGAEPILSREPLWDADIGTGYDLIWSGSLLTHFPADAWEPTLRHFASALAPDGVLIFTTHGKLPLAFLRAEPDAVAYLGPWVPPAYGLTDTAVKTILMSVERCGFGYAPYPGAEKRGDGLSISLREWVDDRLPGSGLDLVRTEEGGWGGHQDVFTVARPNTAGT